MLTGALWAVSIPPLGCEAERPNSPCLTAVVGERPAGTLWVLTPHLGDVKPEAEQSLPLRGVMNGRKGYEALGEQSLPGDKDTYGGTMGMKFMVWFGLMAVIAVAAGCKKSEPTYTPPAAPPSYSQNGGGMSTAPADIPKIEGGGVTVVPDVVKGKWKAVVLVVEDKGQKQSKEYTVEIGKTLQIPNSKIVVDVLDFLPDMKIENSTFTSASNDPNNPAVHVVVREDGKEIFKGWLFSIFPTIHPFQHAQFGVTLKEGVPS